MPKFQPALSILSHRPAPALCSFLQHISVDLFFHRCYFSVVQICRCVIPCGLASNCRLDIHHSRRSGVLEDVIRQQQYCQSQEFAAVRALTAVLLVYSHVQVSILYDAFQPASKPPDDRPLPLDTEFSKTENRLLL